LLLLDDIYIYIYIYIIGAQNFIPF
jgi:hypothetical protein